MPPTFFPAPASSLGGPGVVWGSHGAGPSESRGPSTCSRLSGWGNRRVCLLQRSGFFRLQCAVVAGGGGCVRAGVRRARALEGIHSMASGHLGSVDGPCELCHA